MMIQISNYFFNLVFVAIRIGPGNQFRKETSQKQLGTNNNSRQRKKKKWLVSHIPIRCLISYTNEFFGNQPNRNTKAGQKAQHSHGTKKMHGPLAKLADKKDG